MTRRRSVVDRKMMEAVLDGNVATVRKMIDKYGLSYVPEWEDGFDLWFEALGRGNMEVAKLVLARGAKVCNESGELPERKLLDFYLGSTKDMKFWNLLLKKCPVETFLFFAVSEGSMKLTLFIVNVLKASLNIVNKISQSLLHVAVQKGCLETAKWLIDSGADVDAADKYGRTVLYDAILSRNVDVIRFILECRPDVNLKGNRDAVLLAVKSGFQRVIRNFIEAGFDVLPETPAGMIFDAIFSGDTKLLYSVLEKIGHIKSVHPTRGYDIAAKYKEIGLYYAIKYREIEVAELLIRYGADVNGLNCWGDTLIDTAVLFKDIDMLQLFLKSSNKEEVDPEALFTATIENLPEFVECLLESGANPNAVKNGQTPLHHAARQGYVRCARLLLKYGANVNAINKKGKSALLLAISTKKLKMVRLLLENRADVNLETRDTTPLHAACRIKDVNFAASLLAFGADLEFPKFFGCGDETPVHTAGRSRREEVVRFLVKYGADMNFLYDDVMCPLQSAGIRAHWRTGDSCSDETIKFMMHHIDKMHCAGLFVCDETLEALDDIMFDFVRADIKPECEKEITMMKADVIGDYDWSLFDVLIATPAKLAKRLEDKSLRKLLSELWNLRKDKYTLYGDMLSWKIRNAEREVDLLEICFKFFSVACPELPPSCVKEISRCLTDTDRRMLFFVCHGNAIYYF